MTLRIKHLRRRTTPSIIDDISGIRILQRRGSSGSQQIDRLSDNFALREQSLDIELIRASI
ncbi:hypothetical protein D3C78_1608070 [compost metagenome]